MSFDSRLFREELRRAADAHDLREEDALRDVKAQRPIAWADLTVVTLDVSDSPRATRARTQRFVGALAACALIAGAVALPIALRTQSRTATRAELGSSAPSSTCGSKVTAGYRSVAVVRVAAAPAATPTTTAPTIKLGEPVQLALGLCLAALSQSRLRPAPDIGLAATTNVNGDLLSLSVVTPTRAGTTTLARNWINEFVGAREAEWKGQARVQQRLLILRVQMLHRNLRSVDTELARLMPGTYGGLPEYETPSSSLPGRPASNPPPVPEGGTPHALDLAFERIQLLQQLTQAGESVASTRIAGVSPDVVASFVSLSLPVLIHAPHHDSHTSTVLLAIGLLTGGVLLAGAAFWLGRRGRRPQAS